MTKNKSSRSFFIHLMPIALITICFCGCSKEKMDEMVAQAKDKAAEFSEKSEDALENAKATADILKDQVTEAASSAKDTASNLASEASDLASGAIDVVSMNGNATITLDAPTNFSAAYIRVIPFDEEQSVFQLRSYSRDGNANVFPAYFIQGTVTQKSLDSLAGKTIPCRLFAQKTADGHVWENATGQLINVQVQKSQDAITASFSSANLVNSAGVKTVSSGKFECVSLD